MAIAQKIKIALVKRNMNVVALAERLGCTPTNMYNKLKRDNFSENELHEIAEALNCSFEGNFVFLDTGDRI